jgi:hypothetical protein
MVNESASPTSPDQDLDALSIFVQNHFFILI